MASNLKRLNEKLKVVYSKVEKSLGTTTKTIIGLAVLGTLAFFTHDLLTNRSEITNSTVMITSLNEKGGGSGSVISSEKNKSLVLTNSHICESLTDGGLVKTSDGEKHTISSFVVSDMHDLCLITVPAKLPGRVSIANSAPKMFEVATVSGHPALLPNVVTQGHFSGKKIIDVFTGLRECQKSDFENEEALVLCYFFGGMPQIRTYETILVTATIMPGSSGSAVYNSNKELSAVVFAGSDSIGYAFAVPYEYVRSFLNEEVDQLTPFVPDYERDIFTISAQQNKTKFKLKNIKDKCENQVHNIESLHIRSQVEHLCSVIIRDGDWRN